MRTTVDLDGDVAAAIERTRSEVLLAAQAIELGVVLMSADTDIARFTGLRWANPLTPD